jgi:hypothetical protein
MTEQELKQHKLTPEAREYHRERQRKLRLQNKKCSCGRPAFARTLLTQELKCNRCMVAILKESLQKEKGETKQ